MFRFLDNYEGFKSNQKLEKEIRIYLKTNFDVDGKKPFYKAVSTEFGFHTLEMKKDLLKRLNTRKIINKFEEFAQKIFLKEFGILLELKDEHHSTRII